MKIFKKIIGWAILLNILPCLCMLVGYVDTFDPTKPHFTLFISYCSGCVLEFIVAIVLLIMWAGLKLTNKI